MNGSSLERLVPDLIDGDEATGLQSLKLHLERYEFAVSHTRPGRVLDIACGVGYGAHLISQMCGEKVIEICAVDVSTEAIEYAQHKYKHPKIQFICADGTSYVDAGGFETIVSLETIEHLPNPNDFVTNLKRLLSPNGVLIASAPITPSVDVNPHHLSDFTQKSFRKLFQDIGLTEVASLKQIQPYKVVPLLNKSEKRAQDLRKDLLGYYLQHPEKAISRAWSTITKGFNNHYLTIVWTSHAANLKQSFKGNCQ